MELSELATLACLAYRTSGEDDLAHCREVQHILSEKGMWIECFGSGGTEGYIACHPTSNTAYVVFRGTERTWVDIRNDLHTWPVWNSNGPGKVHRGTQRALNAVWPEVLTLLQELRITNVHFVGHSLGAMLATLAACWCCDDLPEVVVSGVTGFGGPPCGDAVFAGAVGFILKGRIRHVINEVDIVPRLLTTRVLMNYQHPGVIYYITPDCKLIERPSRWRRIRDILIAYSSAVVGFIRGRGFTTPGISAHSIQRYRERLAAIEQVC